MPRLTENEKVTIEVLNSKNETNRSVARRLGVSEGTVRYHLRKVREGRRDEDGRREKRFLAQEHAEAIEHWLCERQSEDGQGRTRNLAELHEWLVAEHGYGGSYRSVWRYVRAHYPRPKRRPCRRVELPPGAQAQVDWCERRLVIGGQERTVYGFFMVLAHSRAEALVWRESMDQLHWQQAHNEGFARIGGVPATVRIDNLATGMDKAGPTGRVNAIYARYAAAAGFHVDACPVRLPRAKGKVERRIGALVGRILRKAPEGFDSLEQLQAFTDALASASARKRLCPASGESVAVAHAREKELLRGCECLPEIFDTVLTRKVRGDCTVPFEGRSYSVPFHLAWQQVEVRGGPGTVSFLHAGREVARHRRATAERVLVDPSHYEGPATDTHEPPLPLGKMGARLLEIAEAPVQLRSPELYQRLMEVAR
jgi:transposase